MNGRQTQMDLSPKARTTDPATSHEAAASVIRVSETQDRILRLLTEWGIDGLTDDEIWRFRFDGLYGYSPSGIRSRRAELVRMGLVRDSGRRRATKSGRRAVVWEAVDG